MTKEAGLAGLEGDPTEKDEILGNSHAANTEGDDYMKLRRDNRPTMWWDLEQNEWVIQL